MKSLVINDDEETSPLVIEVVLIGLRRRSGSDGPTVSTEKKNNDLVREKGRDLTQSYDKSPYTKRKTEKKKVTTLTPPATSIADRLRTVCLSYDNNWCY